jgi:replicative DNA helicase
LIIVNYLQLLRSDQKHDSRAEELAAACRALKALARELKLPLAAVFRLDRLADNRPVELESDLIWLCEKAGNNLWLTQTRWRDGPAGASIELGDLWLKTQNNSITNEIPTTPKTNG